MSMGSRLRTAQQICGLSEAAIASHLECATSTFRHYKSGTRNPRLETLLAISDLLEVNLHWLLTGEGPMDLPDPSAARPMPSGSTAGRDTLSEAHPHASDTFLPPPASRRGRVRTWLADALGLSCIFGITWFGLVAGWVMS